MVQLKSFLKLLINDLGLGPDFGLELGLVNNFLTFCYPKLDKSTNMLYNNGCANNASNNGTDLGIVR